MLQVEQVAILVVDFSDAEGVNDGNDNCNDDEATFISDMKTVLSLAEAILYQLQLELAIADADEFPNDYYENLCTLINDDLC